MRKALLLSALFLGYCLSAQDTVYVDADATGANDGSSWADAFTDFYTAVDYTNSIGVQYWVAEGIYTLENPQMPLMLLYGEKLYGGFNGTETSLSQRDPELYRTIFTADVNGNDSAGTYYDNAPRIFDIGANIGYGDTAEVVFDGVTITSAYNLNGSAGGISCAYGQRALKINNCIFQNNRALNRASILFYSSYYNSKFTLTNTIFRNNVNQHFNIEYRMTGNTGQTCQAIIANCLFENNNVNTLGTVVGAQLGRFTNLSLGIQEVILINNTFVNNSIFNATPVYPSLFALEKNGSTVNDIIVHAYNNLFYKNLNANELYVLTNNHAVTGMPATNSNTNGGDLPALNTMMMSSVYDTASPFVNNANRDYRPTVMYANGGTAAEYNAYPLPNVALNGLNRFDANGGIAIGAYQSQQTSGVGLSEHNAGFQVYPNPVQNELNLAANFPIESLRVINAQGQVVLMEKTAKEFQVKLALASLKAGMYWIQIEGEGQLESQSILKQ